MWERTGETWTSGNVVEVLSDAESEKCLGSVELCSEPLRWRLTVCLAASVESVDFLPSRDVAQPGRALAWGARGRQFKSARPDQFLEISRLQAVAEFRVGF